MLVTFESQSIKENQPSDVPETSLCVFTIRSRVSCNKELNDHRTQRQVQELSYNKMFGSREHLVRETGGSNLGGSDNLQLGNTLPSGIKVSATGEEVSCKAEMTEMRCLSHLRVFVFLRSGGFLANAQNSAAKKIVYIKQPHRSHCILGAAWPPVMPQSIRVMKR